MTLAPLPDVATLRPGLVLDGKVRLVRPLGEGAMGMVWIARHLTLDVDVAVKLIRQFSDDPEVRARFDMEAKAAARIRSPHVVHMLDHGIAEGDRPYMVMELLDGESLANRLERTGWLSITQCVQVVSQVATALDRAHAVGVVHRDVKPENIFLCPGEEGPFVKLLDFGVAKTTALGQDPKLTNAGVMIGTPEYMSRQQIISSKAAGASADLWALSVVIYEMLTGDVPFTGETVGQVCVAICQGEFVPPTMLRKGLPPEIDRWFEAILSRDASIPFETASELAKSFRATIMPDRYSFSDELSGEFRVRTGTMVGPMGSSGDRETPRYDYDAQPDDAPPILGAAFDDLPVVESTHHVLVAGDSGGPTEEDPRQDPAPDRWSDDAIVSGVGAETIPKHAAPSRWLAAGLLPLVVAALLFAVRPAPSVLGGFDVTVPQVAAAGPPASHDELVAEQSPVEGSSEPEPEATASADAPVAPGRPPRPASSGSSAGAEPPPARPPSPSIAPPPPAPIPSTDDARRDYGF